MHPEPEEFTRLRELSDALAKSRRQLSKVKAKNEELESRDRDQAASIAALEKAGYLVHKPTPIQTPVLDITRLTGKDRIKLAVVSCTHFGSKYQQVTALRDFCRYADEVARVDAFVHGGDVEDGPAHRHRNPSEVFKHEYDTYLDYCTEVLPKTSKPWYMISGNHDDWWTLDGGPDMIKALCERREDCTYLGKSLGYLRFQDTLIEVVHLNMGGSYAYSYRSQKHIESLSSERRPAVSLIGNFHKFNTCIYKEVLAVQLPSFQAQSAWMAGKNLVSEVGGVIVEIGLHPNGITPLIKWELVYEFHPKATDWP